MAKVKSDVRVLVACEQSQTVCKAFRALDIVAYSCDINPCYGGHPEWHILGDALAVIDGNCVATLEDGSQLQVHGTWDLLVAHPPCTMLTHSSAVAFASGKHSYVDVLEGARFFLRMLAADCRHIAVENPAPMKIAGLPPYNQIIQPYQFGHPFSKRVCLWLRNLPPLIPMGGYYANHVQWLLHCAGTSRRRSKTFEGIAEAMAAQWSATVIQDLQN